MLGKLLSMTDSAVHDALGLIAELFSWIGLGVGLLFLGAWGVVALARTAWVATDAVVLDDGFTARWLTEEGELHERRLEAWELHDVDDPEQVAVLYRRYSPDRMRLASANHGGRTLGILAIVFLGVGAVALIGSVVLMLVG